MVLFLIAIQLYSLQYLLVFQSARTGQEMKNTVFILKHAKVCTFSIRDI